VTNSEEHIVLFDMDGTLTESRQVIHEQIVKKLKGLAQISNVEIGIVTGSDYDYVQQQLQILLDDPEIRQKLHVMPCNGTKYYIPPQDAGETYQLVCDEDMTKYLGKKKMRNLMQLLIERQSRFSHSLDDLTGHFISYRGSMINWCPIGRNASEEQRYEFMRLDAFYEPALRLRELKTLELRFRDLGFEGSLVAKLGGDTSFDIYPKGWDKTYCLRHFSGRSVWFVGDRCYENGNDYEIYTMIDKQSQAFKTEGPRRTFDIIEEIKIKILKSNYNKAPLPR
tara:strand:- start:145 stop:987 length:843 start_codon:yes stop_codon:yes gene_type:complete